MKKKLLKTTVVASLALGSIAGYPWSTEGFNQVIGTNVANATSSVSYPKLPAETEAWLNKGLAVYNALTPEEQKSIIDMQDAVEGLQNNVTNEAIVAPIVDFINSKKSSNMITKSETLSNLQFLAHMVSTKNADQLSQKLNQFRSDSYIRGFFDKIADGSGVSLDGSNQIEFSDITGFSEAVKTALLANITITEAFSYISAQKNGTISDNTTLKNAFKADLNAALTQVLASQTLKLSQVLNTYAKTDADKTALVNALVSTYMNSIEKFDSKLLAHSAIIKGTIRSEASLTATTGTTELTPDLKILTYSIPNDLITWTSSNSNISYSTENKKFTLSSSAAANTDHTSTVNAYDSMFNELLFTGEITLKRTVVTNPETPPVSPVNPGGVIPPADQAEQAKKANDAVNQAKAAIQNASPKEKAAIVKEAVKDVKEAVKNIGKVTVTDAVTVKDGKGTASVNSTDVINQIKQIKEQVEAFQKGLREVEPKVKVPFEFTLDFGNVDANTLSIPLGGDILGSAKDNGVTKLNVEANGTGVGFDPSEFNEDTTLSIVKVPKDTVTSLTERTTISPILDITFATPTGTEIHNFSKPIDLRLNIPTHPEPDYLSIFKVEVDNRLTNYGGKFIDGGVSTQRITFSKYVVLENKVEFADTTAVKDWAGKQITAVASKGIVEGRGEGKYDPDAHITRAEFAKMVSKALGIVGGKDQEEKFADVTSNDWFQPYVAAVQKFGITNGRTKDNFEPNAKITRAEMATMMARALENVQGAQSFSTTADVLAQFKDAADIHATLKDGVAFSADQGIVVGLPSEKFAPNAFTTRAEAAVMIYRLLQQ